MDNSGNDLFSRVDYTDSTGQKLDEAQSRQIKYKEQQETLQKVEAYIQEQAGRSTNYVLGFLGALVGAAIGAIPWGIVGYTGYFVGWLGFLIAFLASKGYDLCKVKTNKVKVICVIVTSIIGVLLGQIICDIIAIKTDPMLGKEFSNIFLYFTSNFGEYLSINSENLALGIIFAFLGGFTVIRDISKNNKLINDYKKGVYNK